MLIYWFMFLLPAWFAIANPSQISQRQLMPWIIVSMIFILLIGFRFEVGGDWGTYLKHYYRATGVSLSVALEHGDPGYVFLNWLMASWGWGISGVNLIAAIIFTAGLAVFCRQQPNPWMALAVAVPYLVVVVGMGYTRQGVAIGLLMLAITYLERGKIKHYLLLLVVAALFHKTAVLMIPLGIFLKGHGPFIRILAVGLVAYGTWDLLLAEKQDDLWKNYVELQMQSQGARIRTFMNLIPSLLLLFYWRRWQEIFPNFWFWFWISIGSILSFAFVGVASTAADRIALYFIPIQLVVFSRLPYLANRQLPESIIVLGVVLGYVAVMFVWLNFAAHAQYWLPYQNFLFL